LKIKRNVNRNAPLMQKLESGGLGGSFRPASRPAYDRNAELYNQINDGLGKAFKYGRELFEGIMDEVFDVKMGSHKRAKKTIRKATRF
jgi:hypothetical protein